MKSAKEEMVGNQSCEGAGAYTRAIDAEMEKLKAAAEEIATEKTEAWHKRKKGSVFPAKRRSVKQMICDLVFG